MFFDVGLKNTVNYSVFGHLTLKNHGICSGFCFSPRKNTVNNSNFAVFFMFFLIFWTALVRYTWLSNSSRFFFRQSVLSDVFGLNGRHHWQLRAAAQRCGAGGCRREATWINHRVSDGFFRIRDLYDPTPAWFCGGVSPGKLASASSVQALFSTGHSWNCRQLSIARFTRYCTHTQ